MGGPWVWLKACAVCGGALPDGRRKFCSPKCAYEARKKSEAARNREKYYKEHLDQPDGRNHRAIEDDGKGSALARARKRAGLSQKALTEAIGIAQRSKGTISMWESGQKAIRLQTLQDIARALGVPVESLIDDGIIVQDIAQDRPRDGRYQSEPRPGESAMRRLRKAAGLTQREMELRMGIMHSGGAAITRWERGITPISREAIHRAAVALGVQDEELIDGKIIVSESWDRDVREKTKRALEEAKKP